MRIFGLEGWFEKRWKTESCGSWRRAVAAGATFFFLSIFWDHSNMDGWLPKQNSHHFLNCPFLARCKQRTLEWRQEEMVPGMQFLWDVGPFLSVFGIWTFLQFSVNSPSFLLRKKETFIISLTCFQPSFTAHSMVGRRLQVLWQQKGWLYHLWLWDFPSRPTCNLPAEKSSSKNLYSKNIIEFLVFFVEYMWRLIEWVIAWLLDCLIAWLIDWVIVQQQQNSALFTVGPRKQIGLQSTSSGAVITRTSSAMMVTRRQCSGCSNCWMATIYARVDQFPLFPYKGINSSTQFL